MPDFHYVDSGHGIATGDQVYTAAQRAGHSGNITTLANTSVYAKVEDCLNNASIANGDFILVTDDHSYSTGASTTMRYTIGTDITVYIVSIDNQNIENYKKATIFQERGSTTNGWDVNIDGLRSRVIFQGYYLAMGQGGTGVCDLQLNGIGASIEFYDSVVEIANSHVASDIFIAADGLTFKAVDTELKFGDDDQEILPHDDCQIILDNVTNSGTGLKYLIPSTALNGGYEITIRNSRLDQILAANGEIVSALNTGTERATVKINNCLTPSGFSWIETTPTLQTYYEATLQGYGTADEYYNFYHASVAGVVEEDTAQYLTGGATYDGTAGFSFDFSTASDDADVNVPNPLRYPIALLPDQDLSAGKTFAVELVSSDSGLTDVDVWLEIEVQDGTNQALGKKYSTRDSNIFGGSALSTAGVGTWNVTTDTEYKITSATITETGATNTNVVIYACVAKANVTVNFDPAPVVT